MLATFQQSQTDLRWMRLRCPWSLVQSLVRAQPQLVKSLSYPTRNTCLLGKHLQGTQSRISQPVKLDSHCLVWNNDTCSVEVTDMMKEENNRDERLQRPLITDVPPGAKASKGLCGIRLGIGMMSMRLEFNIDRVG